MARPDRATPCASCWRIVAAHEVSYGLFWRMRMDGATQSILSPVDKRSAFGLIQLLSRRNMLTKLMAMGPMFGIAAFTWGADISVVDQPDWRPASEAQREALHLKAESHLIDYSFCTSGGVGMIVKAPAKPN